MSELGESGMIPAEGADLLLKDIGAAIDSAPTLSAALAEIAANLGAHIPAIHRVSVRLLEGEHVRVAGVWSAQPTRIAEGVVLRAIATSLPELTPDRPVVIKTAHGGDPALDEVLLSEGIWSWVSIALVHGGVVRGALSMSSGELHAFADDDGAFFRHLGAALEDRLFTLAHNASADEPRAKD